MQEFVKHETARKEKKCKYQQRGGCVCVCVCEWPKDSRAPVETVISGVRGGGGGDIV